MKRVIFAVVLCVLMSTFAGVAAADDLLPCPPTEWCPDGNVRYDPGLGEYTYTDGTAEAGGDALRVTWDRIGPYINEVCITTGRGMWVFDKAPMQHGWLEDYKARICEVVLTTDSPKPSSESTPAPEPTPVEDEFVPEPGTLLLLASGLAGLAGYSALRYSGRRE